jgi:hypothetical protein
MNRHHVRADIDGFVVRTTETLTLQGGWGAKEYVYSFSLPRGSVVTGLSVIAGKSKRKGAAAKGMKAKLLDSKAVRTKILDRTGLPESSDPAWLEMVGESTFRLRMVPPRAGEPMTAKISYVHLTEIAWGRRIYRYPRLGPDRRFVKTTVVVEDRPPGGGPKKTIVRKVSPKRDLSLRLRSAKRTNGVLDLHVAHQRGPAHKGASGRDTMCGGQGRGGVAMATVIGRALRRKAKRAHLVFAVDVSRSMWKASRKHAGELLSALLTEIGGGGRFQVIGFSRRVHPAFRSPVRITPGNAAKAKAWLRRLKAENGTEVGGGLAKAVEEAKRMGKGRKLVVLMTDGLLPEEGEERLAVTSTKGVELVVVIGMRAHRSIWELREGPLAKLARSRGFLAYGVDPFSLAEGKGERTGSQDAGKPSRKRRHGRSDRVEVGGAGWKELAGRVARPGRVTHIRLAVDGKSVALDRDHRQVSTGSGFFHLWRYRGAPPKRATLSFVHRGRRRTVRAVFATSSPRPTAGAGHLVQIETARELSRAASRVFSGDEPSGPKREGDGAGRGGADGPARTSAWREGRSCSLRAGIASWATSFVVVDPTSSFSADRLRFARKWGHRFFRRLAPEGSPDMSVFFGRSGEEENDTRVKVVSTGSLTKDVVLKVLRRGYLKAAKACYQRRVGLGATRPNLPEGRVVLVLDLSRGEVARVELDRSELGDVFLERCLMRAAYKLNVPRSRRDRTVYRVLYPLRFRLDKRTVEILSNAGYTPKVNASENPLEGLE